MYESPTDLEKIQSEIDYYKNLYTETEPLDKNEANKIDSALNALKNYQKELMGRI